MNLTEKLPYNIKNIIKEDERIAVSLKGAFKEWLICTDKQVYIIKKGFMTGHLFGSSIFQMPYRNITSTTVNYHLASGYFEISTGGMQNTNKSYWASGQSSPQRSPNCVSITGKKNAEKFKEACNFINENLNEFALSKENASSPNNDIPAQIKKIADLKEQGILTESEFLQKKSELLKRM